MLGSETAHGDAASHLLIAEGEHDGGDDIDAADKKRVIHEIIIEGGAVEAGSVELGSKFDGNFGRKSLVEALDQNGFGCSGKGRGDGPGIGSVWRGELQA